VERRDATALGLPPESFDAVANFLGLEDVAMTRGRDGVQRAFLEASRVLRPGGVLSAVLMTPDLAQTQAQQTEIALFSYLCGATWYPMGQYRSMLGRAGFEVHAVLELRTGRKLTPRQAEQEIRFACENVPELYGVAVHSFDEVWDRFGESIRRHGMGHYSALAQLSCRRGGPPEPTGVHAWPGTRCGFSPAGPVSSGTQQIG
jgi:SAM-dependent methyltransferase